MTAASLVDFDQVLQENIERLRAQGFNPIILYGHKLHRQFFESKNYEPRWRSTKLVPKGLEFLEGFFKDTFVFRFPVEPNCVVIYDPARFGEFVHYKVDEDKPDFPLSISVNIISEEKAKEYLVKNPDLAKQLDTGEVLSEKDAIRKVQQHVELAIWQRFKIENVDKKSGIVIKFDDPGTA
jgi:hypothetical protein